MLSRHRSLIAIIITAFMLLVIGSMTRMNDATAKTVAAAKELARKGRFREATTVLREARAASKDTSIAHRLDEALNDVEWEKRAFSRLDKVLEHTDDLSRRFMFTHGIDILEQVREANLSIEDLHRVDIALAKLRTAEEKNDPTAPTIRHAQRLAQSGDVAGAIALLQTARAAARANGEHVSENKLKNAQYDIEDTERVKHAPAASSPSTGLHNGAAANPSVSGSPSGLSGAASSQQQDNRSFQQKVSDKLQHWLGLEEPKSTSLTCTRD